MEAVTTAITEVTAVVATVFGALTANPLLTFFLAASVLGVGLRVFRKLKGTAGG